MRWSTTSVRLFISEAVLRGTLLRVDSLEPFSEEPEPILRSVCILGAVRSEVEEQVKAAQGQHLVPEGYPTNRLFVNRALRSAVIHWSHSSAFPCHPRIKKTLY